MNLSGVIAFLCIESASDQDFLFPTSCTYQVSLSFATNHEECTSHRTSTSCVYKNLDLLCVCVCNVHFDLVMFINLSNAFV